jgi:hypothetical protein
MGGAVGGPMASAATGMAAGQGLNGLVEGLMGESPFMKAIQSLGTGQVANPFAAAQPGVEVATPTPDFAPTAGGNAPPLQPDNLPQLAALPPVDTSASQPVPQTPAVQPVGGQGGYRDTITRAAQKWGIDPNVALRVAKAEGGLDDWIQSKVKKNGRQEPSYGPFQMLVGGPGTGFPEGMGNQIMRERGIDPRDPRNAEAVIDFAMEQASKKGWGQWYGAKAAGLDNMAGIGGRPAGVSPMTQQVQGGTGSPTVNGSGSATPAFGFNPATEAGPGETAQKDRWARVAKAMNASGSGRGVSVQTSEGSSQGGGQAFDDSGEFLQSAAARVEAAKNGTLTRGASRKDELRRKLRGEA